jgi:hypothetical protein
MSPRWPSEQLVHLLATLASNKEQISISTRSGTSLTGTGSLLHLTTDLLSNSCTSTVTSHSLHLNEVLEITHTLHALLDANPKSSPSHHTALLTHSCIIIVTPNLSPKPGYPSLVYMVRNLVHVSRRRGIFTSGLDRTSKYHWYAARCSLGQRSARLESKS